MGQAVFLFYLVIFFSHSAPGKKSDTWLSQDFGFSPLPVANIQWGQLSARRRAHPPIKIVIVATGGEGPGEGSKRRGWGFSTAVLYAFKIFLLLPGFRPKIASPGLNSETRTAHPAAHLTRDLPLHHLTDGDAFSNSWLHLLTAALEKHIFSKFNENDVKVRLS